MRKNRIIFRKTAAVFLTSCVMLSFLPVDYVMAETVENMEEQTEETQPVGEVITISSKKDFLDFAKNSNIDAWSVGKVIDLQADIDLTGTNFSQIPIFAGKFQGNGHTISGFQYKDTGYVTGLFRYLAVGGEISDLTLRGVIDTQNEKECVGGICGSNAGIIKNCTFEGSVSGKSKIGGIAGINEISGTIRDCKTKGQLSGSYYTGGIAGQNFGSLEGCINEANINADNAWVEEDDASGMEWLKEISGSEEKRLKSGVDTGGITGYSTGIIINCQNSGTVGYEHTGYNIGGIAGRQSGMLSNCINKGIVYGRKDVGGIVGQMEPFISLDNTDSLADAVQGLHDKIDTTLVDMDAASDALNADCATLQGYADSALTKSQTITTQMTDFANKNVASLAQVAGRIEYVADRFPDVMEQISAASSAMTAVHNDIQNMGQSMRDAAANVNQTITGETVPNMQGNVNDTTDFGANISQADDALDNSDTIMNEIQDMLNDGNMHDPEDDILVTDATADDTADAIADDIEDSLDKPDGTEENKTDTTVSDTVKEASKEELQNKISELQKQVEIAQSNASSVLGAASSMQQSVASVGQNADFGQLSNDTQTMANALSQASSQLKSIGDYLKAQPDITFYQMDGTFQGNVNGLYSDLQGISGSMATLRTNMSDSSDKLTQDFRDVNDQLNAVFMLFLERMDEVKSPSLENIYQDISEEDIDNVTQGKVAGSINRGKVEGDINVGGISGSMALDEEDPEDNAAGSTEEAVGNRYLTQCILMDCKNYGTVKAKKDGAGCVNGYMHLGIINHCEAYGSAKSTEGDYVGGISGEARARIRQCFSLCTLSGDKYVGGIAGYAVDMQGNYAMADISSESGRGGEIAGQVGTKEKDYVMAEHIIGNYYVSDDLAGIDNISYAGSAEPLTYDALLTVQNLPADYRHLTVYYMVDGECVDTVEVPYGTKLADLEQPEVPKKNGYNGSWQEVGSKRMHGNVVLEAEYDDEITVLASKETSISGKQSGVVKSCAFLEGKFTKDAVLHAGKSEEPYPTGINKDTAFVYDITMENIKIDTKNPLVLRLLNTAGEKATVFKQTDGKWKEVDAVQKGGYLQLTIDETNGVYCVAEKTSQAGTVVVAAGLVVVILTILIIKRKKRVKKEEKQKK